FMAEMLKQELELPERERSSSAETPLEPSSSTGARHERESLALDRLVALIERNRRRVEDSVADELFAEAAGFAPGRISSTALSELVDVEWIGRMLRWDSKRTLEWARSRRPSWTRD